tara:strand:- start:517 stop:1677 length:1161 start_codon:yes stop_codon:yes gene_type:complete
MISSWKKQGYSIDAMRLLARNELPKPVFDYADGGAEREITMRSNESAFKRYALVPKPLRGAANRDLSATLFGKKITLPLVIGPTGLSGLFWPDGEREAAKATAEAGTIFCLSHGSTCTIEELAATGISPRWMQVFIYREREFTRELCKRAQASGYEALILTLDNQVIGKRERDLANGFTIPPEFNVFSYIQMITKYRWLWRMRNAYKNLTFANYARAGEKTSLYQLAQRMSDILDPGMTWDDISWLRDIWKGPLIIKGVLDPEDAAKATTIGIDALVISNHGGRQLDGAITSLAALPSIVEVVSRKMPILIDGGIRRGTDILKVLALGATACMIGRPHLWGLSVAGKAGVKHVIDIYAGELDTAMGLCGIKNLAEITPELLSKIDN